MTSVSPLARWVLGAIAIAGVASAAAGCSGETSPSSNLTTLYIFADYATPSVTVTINAKSLGTISQQYTGTTDCGVLSGKGIADGVLSVPITGGAHYAINWTFSSGKADADSFDATPDFFSVPCLLEPIDAPSTNVVHATARTIGVVSGGNR